jgi:DNA polymerase III delta prime subunit
MPHVLLYGPSGVGKSTLAGSASKPQVVFLFDSIGNATKPYFANMRIKRDKDPVLVHGKVSFIDCYLCYDIEDIELTTLKRKLWHFDPASPDGKDQFEVKRPLIRRECQEINANSFVFDSLTLFQTSMRVNAKRDVGNDPKAEEALAYAVTDYVEDLCITLCALPLDVFMCAHVSDRTYNKRIGKNMIAVDDTRINAPGRMGRNITAMFSDVWYCHIDEEDNYKVLTRGDSVHVAKNTVNADMVCDNDYRSIIKQADPIVWL